MNGAKILGVKSVAKLATVAMVATALSGCGMGSLWGGGTSGETTGSTASIANSSATQSEINTAGESALPAIATECPPIKVRSGAGSFASYAGSSKTDPNALKYQAVIDKQSRNCIVSNGLISVNMGVVGRVVMGPAGNQKEVTVPVRFAVQRDGMAVFSQRYDIPVGVPNGDSAEFVKVIDDVDIPYLGGEDITIWVGFDTSSS